MVVMAYRFWRSGMPRLNVSQFWALALFAWFAASLGWSPDPLQGQHQLFPAAALLVAFLVARHLPLRGPVTIAYACILALAFGTSSDTSWLPWGGLGNENFVTEFLLIGAPLVVRPYRLFLWPVAASYLFFHNPSKIEFWVAACAVAAMLLWDCRRDRFGVVLVMIALAGCAAFVLWTGMISESVLPRAEIWLNTTWLALHDPIAGTGFGGFTHDYASYQGTFVTLFGAKTWLTSPAMAPVEAHNEYLQLWAEGGIIAVALGWALVASLRLREGETACLYVLCAVALIAFIEFPMQNPQTAVVAALAAGRLAA